MQTVPRRLLAFAVFAVAFAFVCAGCAGGSHSKVGLRITITHYVFEKGQEPKRVTDHYTLNCEPVSGTLPLAGRICSDIARHRLAMLAPGQPRSTCGGSPFMPVVNVDVEHGASGGGFSGSPGCGWPGGTQATIYFEASAHNTRQLARAEPLLRCEDDPVLFAKPTPWASVVACTHGLWTPAAERAIWKAESPPPISSLDPRQLFPRDPGVRRCTIHAGGPAPGRLLHGLCGVSLTGAPSSKTVHFVETWSVARHVFRHHWTVNPAGVVAQTGAPPPQLWS